MKLNKLFFGLLGIATLFAACKENEDDDYKWATATGEQVYFSNDLSSKVELDTNAVVFNIPVKRINAGSAITVPIQCVDTFGVFTYPSSVSFAICKKVCSSITGMPSSFAFFDFTVLLFGSLQIR